MERKKVSIIIPVLNSSDVLEHAIESVITQDYQNIELIIIDGGSTDGSIELIKKYENKINYWCSKKDNGVYGGMNKGIAAASGTWVFFLGADDKLCPGIISEVFNDSFFEDIDLIYGKVRIESKEKNIGRETNYEQLIEKNIPHQAIFYRKSVLDIFKGFDERYKVLADYDLNLKIFEDNSLHKKFINKVVAIVCNTGLSHRAVDQNFFHDKKAYFINHNKFLSTDKKIAQYYFFSGLSFLIKKKTKSGFSNILHGIFFGRNRFNYLLVTTDCLLGMMGIRKRYKCV